MSLGEVLPYMNARLRARKSRLLGAALLRALASTDSVSAALSRLGETPYGPALLRATSSAEADPATAADEALRRTLAEDLTEIRGFSTELITSPARYLFAAWDLANLKAVLRGVRGGAPPEVVVRACSPAGFVPAAVWAEIASAADLGESVARAATMELEFRPGLRQGWADYSRSKDPADLEAALDRHFYRRAWEASASARGGLWEPLRDLIAFDIDHRNLSALLERVARLGEIGTAPLAGGKLTGPAFWRRLSAVTEPAGLLADVVRGWLGGQGEQTARLLEEGHTDAAADTLERVAWRARARRLRGAPLSLEILIGYVWAKVAEVVDLRRIVWGLHLGLPGSWIEDGLLAV